MSEFDKEQRHKQPDYLDVAGYPGGGCARIWLDGEIEILSDSPSMAGFKAARDRLIEADLAGTRSHEAVSEFGPDGRGVATGTPLSSKAAPAERAWEWPVNTVGKLIEALQTLPPEMPFYTAYFVEIDGKRVTRCRNPSLSRETTDSFKVGTFDPNNASLVMWASAAPSAIAPTPGRWYFIYESDSEEDAKERRSNALAYGDLPC